MAMYAAERTEPRNNPIDVLEELVNANEWRFDRSGDDEMVVEVPGRWSELRLFFVWQEDLSAMYFSCLFDLRVPEKKRVAAAELLSLINEKLWLGHFDLCSDELVPTEDELHAVRFEFDPAPALETLMLHFCGEIRLNHWYRRAAEWHSEPVIRHIYETLAKDEARHGGAYLRYMKRAMQRFGDEARAAFAKVGVLMASARRTAQALHPTNLHVNAQLFPRDTIQSRLPDPAWLEHWLDKQIQFDATWETKVVERILHNLSLLLERSFASVQELNRYRKEVSARVALAATATAPAA